MGLDVQMYWGREQEQVRGAGGQQYRSDPRGRRGRRKEDWGGGGSN